MECHPRPPRERRPPELSTLRPRRRSPIKQKARWATGWTTPPDAAGRSHHGTMATIAKRPSAVRIEHRPIQSPCRAASWGPGSGGTSILPSRGPIGTSPQSNCRVVLFRTTPGPGADVAPGDWLAANRADRFGRGARMRDEAPTGSEVDHQMVERPGMPPESAMRNDARPSCPRFVHGAGPQQTKGAVGDRVGNSARHDRAPVQHVEFRVLGHVLEVHSHTPHDSSGVFPLRRARRHLRQTRRRARGRLDSRRWRLGRTAVTGRGKPVPSGRVNPAPTDTSGDREGRPYETTCLVQARATPRSCQSASSASRPSSSIARTASVTTVIAIPGSRASRPSTAYRLHTSRATP